MADKEKSYFATRAAIGKLFVACAMDTDPAHILSFTSALIQITRAALIQRLEDKIPDHNMIPGVFNSILYALISKWQTEYGLEDSSVKELDKRVQSVFKTESMTLYGASLYRDAIFCEDLHLRWKEANQIYIANRDAWSISNSMISDIHKQLFEIITRHDLMQFPKGEPFNLDSGMGMSDIASVAQRMNNARSQERA